MKAKPDRRVSSLDAEILLAEKQGKLAEANKLRRRRAATLGGISRQKKQAATIADTKKRILKMWELEQPRPNDLFAEQNSPQHEIIKNIADETGLSPNQVRRITAKSRISAI